MPLWLLMLLLMLPMLMMFVADVADLPVDVVAAVVVISVVVAVPTPQLRSGQDSQSPAAGREAACHGTTAQAGENTRSSYIHYSSGYWEQTGGHENGRCTTQPIRNRSRREHRPEAKAIGTELHGGVLVDHELVLGHADA